MSARPPKSLARPFEGRRGAPPEPGPGGDWPRTWRVLPWSIAAFLALIWLAPVDSIAAPISLPVDSALDRLALGALAVVWFAVAIAGGRFTTSPRHSLVGAALLLLLAVAATSVVLNADMLIQLGELGLAIKKLGLLAAFALFFLVVVTGVRPGEVAAFARLTLALACLTAAGTILEYRSGVNLFFDLARSLNPGGLVVSPPPDDPTFGRAAVTGPTLHGLVVATMLALALPIAIIGMLQARAARSRVLYAIAMTVVFAGAVATNRKSAIIVPFAVVLVLVAYRPSALLRLAPLGVILVALVPVLSPGALGSLRAQLLPGRVASDTSTTGRTADYAAIRPDVRTRPLLGRGYGTYDSDRYRILDNQYLGLALEVGAVGVGAFLFLLVATVMVANRAIRAGDPVRGPPALAAAAATAGVAVGAVMYDLLAYPQVPYLFLFLAALAVVCSDGLSPRRTARAPYPARTPGAALPPPPRYVS